MWSGQVLEMDMEDLSRKKRRVHCKTLPRESIGDPGFGDSSTEFLERSSAFFKRYGSQLIDSTTLNILFLARNL